MSYLCLGITKVFKASMYIHTNYDDLNKYIMFMDRNTIL